MGNRKWQVSLSLVNLLNLATILEELYLRIEPRLIEEVGVLLF